MDFSSIEGVDNLRRLLFVIALASENEDEDEDDASAASVLSSCPCAKVENTAEELIPSSEKKLGKFAS